MEQTFWKEVWETNRIMFHQRDINPHLQRFYPELKLVAGAPILVPLCGKSRDMLWLNEQGHPIIGVELSEIAVRAFFEENGMTPTVTQEERFVHYSHGTIELLQGDFFGLTPERLGEVGAVYDRAALVALPSSLRSRYAEAIAALLSPGTRLLLIANNYPQHEMSGPPFAVSDSEVDKLFGEAFELEKVHQEDILESAPRFKERGISRLTLSAFLGRRR